MDIIMFWLGVWHSSLGQLPPWYDWQCYFYHLFPIWQQQLKLAMDQSLLTGANLTSKVSGHYMMCIPHDARQREQLNQSWKRGKGAAIPEKVVQRTLGDCRVIRSCFNWVTLIFQYSWKPSIHTKSSVAHFQRKTSTAKFFHHPVKPPYCEDAGKIETRRLLPIKTQSQVFLHHAASYFLILTILCYTNTPHVSSPGEFSWITHLNIRSRKRAWVHKPVLHANTMIWVLWECCPLLTFLLSFLGW